MCYNLGNNPLMRLSWFIRLRVPTFRLHAQMYYFPAAQRWLTTREKLAMMGWPVYPSLAAAANVPLMAPSFREGRHMLGNAMHLPSVYVVLLTALASAELRMGG